MTLEEEPIGNKSSARILGYTPSPSSVEVENQWETAFTGLQFRVSKNSLKDKALTN
jgi:hypothetical protein